MDGTTFDDLIKRLATTPLSRSNALRGLAASVATLAGVTLAAEPGAAKNNNRGEKKRKVCHCPDTTVANCRTLKKGKEKVENHLKRHQCDYKGKCSGFNPCCLRETAVCTADAQCCAGLFCGDGICRPTGSCLVLTTACTADTQCCSGLCSQANVCVTCLPVGDNTCAVDADCCSGNCQGTTCFVCKTNGIPCSANSECCSRNCNVMCLAAV